MVQSRGSSLTVTVLLLLTILAVFILQIALQEREVLAEKSAGTDLAIIGGTTAALLAALEGAENGAQVFLFPHGQELAEDLAFLIEGGLAAPLSPPQQKMEIKLQPDTFVDIINKHGDALNDPFLLNAFQNAAENFFTWAKEICACFDYLPQPERQPYLHLSLNARAPEIARKQLLERIRRAGIIIKNDRVREILFSSSGEVEALKLRDERGKNFLFYLQALILADGGFSGDIQAWYDYLPPAYFINLRPQQKGTGLQLARELGIDLVQTDFFNIRIVIDSPEKGKYILLPCESWENTLILNRKAQVLNCSEASAREILHFVLSSPPGETFILAPEEKARQFSSAFRSFEDLNELIQVYSLEDDPQWPGSQPYPPYFLAPLKLGVDYTLGGIAISPEGEVKRKGRLIKGFYAAGEIVGGLHGEALLPGMPLSETLFLAKTAGKAAAKYAQR